MIAAVATTAVLLFGAFIAGGALAWRRHVARPVRVVAKVEGPPCTPRVKR